MPGENSFFKALLRGELPTKSGERVLRSICVFLPSLTHFVRHRHLLGNGAPRACKFHHGGEGFSETL